ncbi:c-type cytochrome [Rhodanobacter glycinis]|uniref:C-type cytochrome n=1 Tax=Rhodanobacter glycinis TaxID=582702 RepID=A0A5B9E0G7_9GAMM|nr:c-type cytochrome [Rhodanobacter glycinis]QEE25398.1 c-type cytochrome [Rhodanobacter glycinis]
MKWLRRLVILIVLLVAVLGGWLFLGGHSDESAPGATSQVSAATLKDPALIARGKYLTTVGDCVSCHTEQGGSDFAGGRILPTPFGNIPTPNITPDKATGLGDWRFEDFWRALHDGIGRHGEFLYPAFSYTSFTKVDRDDALAIFAYLQSLAPVYKPAKPLGLSFPYNVREGLAAWRALYFQEGVYQPDPTKSAAWNRGAYLVQGLGHCNECHAARSAFGGTHALPLSGGRIPVQDWYAPDLSSRAHGGLQGWTEQDIVDLLKNGQAAKGAAFGPMAEVVASSTQYMHDDDLRAIATYLQSLPPRAAPAPAGPVPAATAMVNQGAKIYAASCAGCHGKDGEGVAGVYPPLAGNSSVLDPSGLNAIRAVLLGGFPPTTAGNPRPYSMPPFAQKLSDADVAAVVSYIRHAWSNDAPAVQQRDVFKYRHTPIE